MSLQGGVKQARDKFKSCCKLEQPHPSPPLLPQGRELGVASLRHSANQVLGRCKHAVARASHASNNISAA